MRERVAGVWRWYRGRRVWQQVVIASGMGFVLLVALTPTPEEEPEAVVAATPATDASVAATAAPSLAPAPSAPAAATTPTSTPTAAPSPAVAAGFGDGTWLVGTDIEPGLYRANDASFCYWARLSGLGGDLGDIIANEIGSGFSLVVEIMPSDRAFETSGCGEWAPLESASPSGGEDFGDGTWVVGLDIEPGTYRALGGDSCYWVRLSGFSGELSDILANALPSGGTVVEIVATDTGFATSGCERWEPVE